MNIPLNEVPDTASRKVVFGRVEREDKAIAPSVEGEVAGNGGGNRNNGDGDGDDDGDGDGTMSGGSIDSIRVNTALLAAESQYTHQNRSTRDQDLPVSSRPPIHHAERPYGHIRRRRRRGRIKFEAIKVSQAPEVETTYQRRPSTVLPPRKDSKRAYGVNRPRRRRGRIKIEPGKLKIECLDDKTAQKGETTYCRHA